MTICNMSIEAGARAGMIAPDETTFAYLEGRPGRADGRRLGAGARRLARARLRSRTPSSTREFAIDVAELAPQVTWGTNPEMVVPVTGSRARSGRLRRRRRAARPPSARSPTWASSRARAIQDISVDRVFIGSCTNARIEDLRAAAAVVAGKRVHPSVRALVVPGLGDGQAAGRGRGARPGLRRRRLRVAPGRLLDVPRHEPGHPRRRASAAPRPRTATSRAGRGAAAARTWSARSWPRRRRSRATSSTRARRRCRHEALSPRARAGRGARPRGRRHRPDHPEAVPEADRAHRLRRSSSSSTGASTTTARPPDFELNDPRAAGAKILLAGHELRLRLVARARRLGAAGLRLRGRDRALVRRHLRDELPQDRARPDRAPAGRAALADRRGRRRRRARRSTSSAS